MILLAIRPEFVALILSGKKGFEFRRHAPSAFFSHVVVYETAPVSAITCLFSVERVIEASPRSLWRAYAQQAGIDRTRFERYFDGVDLGYAFQIGRAFRLPAEVSLAQFGCSTAPPQSFQYLPASAVPRLFSVSEAQADRRHYRTSAAPAR